MTPEELGALSISELWQYIDALLDLPRPATAETQANCVQAFITLRDKLDEEHAMALGISVAQCRKLRKAFEARYWATKH